MTELRARDFEPRPCPVCAARRFRVLFRQQFAQVDEATPVRGYDVVVCEHCGCAYADSIPEQEAFDRYYREMSKYEYHQRRGAESEYDRRRLGLIAEMIRPHVPGPDARILDVGCATGRLLADLRAMGFSHVSGLDPSSACAVAAKELYDIEVRSQTLSELASTAECFDLVIMIGVLEHLRDLKLTFDALREILGPRGVVYLEVPDATAFADWPNAPYQDFSTEHINFFSPVSLRNVMVTHGFSQQFLERNHREQAYRTVMSNVSGVYRKEPMVPTEPIQFDSETATGLARYIAQSAADEKRLHDQIDDLVASQRPLLVWGVGTHTARLMATSRLSEANIIGFIESNVRYQGKSLSGLPILPPEVLKERQEAVLISSRVFQHEILEQIRRDLGCSNDVVSLYRV